MMHGREKSDLVIVALKPANKAKEAHCGGVCGGGRSGVGGAKGGAKGNVHQHNTYRTQSRARVTNALERIRPLSPSHTRGGRRLMRQVADDDPRWRQSAYGYGYNADGRMDPPPRSLAREAYDCFMVETLCGFNRIQAWFARLLAANGRLPSDRCAADHPIAVACRRARVRQGQAFGGAEEAPSLTLAARDGDGQYAVGTEECSRRGSNKRME